MNISILPNNVLAKLGEDICGEIMKYHQLSDATLICEEYKKCKADEYSKPFPNGEDGHFLVIYTPHIFYKYVLYKSNQGYYKFDAIRRKKEEIKNRPIRLLQLQTYFQVHDPRCLDKSKTAYQLFISDSIKYSLCYEMKELEKLV